MLQVVLRDQIRVEIGPRFHVAADLDLPDMDAAQRQVFATGLLDAVRATKAWVVTGGTNTGVMKMVGNAFTASGVTVPLMGITSYGCVNGREDFDGYEDESRA